ncbi:hypothetical protein CO112_02700 [Candidatus Dojkabacteria bacterium CG_4_9_14_3_um_filter_150_Dojkabacteria_WS6_41_13]|uniref:Uncharacterized protein n=1 Tax=Candidatus Dojkabacteria bacterium CG_4_10_14_0_2_um_filter_Dojkabacteria_WS6_41_15 TaxID=2014249 RepID=A0A2M7W0Z1_9BACT|nr:MAG: hypothetical protein COX64_04335 [Candidatus Dojkabacteria bacterium CG_4_10_14_0_2_um_filter_Dojkabacteria_WS6_41_15]PJB22750.1 MAG: hypothetical protein CO112_02700 [Candidatus Dojkabacteria bacterium CG_4_9_14_3_um_filter_150_Dojkabacteria_WS6_41_13]
MIADHQSGHASRRFEAIDSVANNQVPNSVKGLLARVYIDGAVESRFAPNGEITVLKGSTGSRPSLVCCYKDKVGDMVTFACTPTSKGFRVKLSVLESDGYETVAYFDPTRKKGHHGNDPHHPKDGQFSCKSISPEVVDDDLPIPNAPGYGDSGEGGRGSYL